MNCKPGDLARIVGLRDMLATVNDRFVRLKNLPPALDANLWVWQLEEKVSFALPSDCLYKGFLLRKGWIVSFDSLPDDYLRPIRDQPGEDETLQWLPVPDEVTA